MTGINSNHLWPPPLCTNTVCVCVCVWIRWQLGPRLANMSYSTAGPLFCCCRWHWDGSGLFGCLRRDGSAPMAMTSQGRIQNFLIGNQYGQAGAQNAADFLKSLQLQYKAASKSPVYQCHTTKILIEICIHSATGGWPSAPSPIRTSWFSCVWTVKVTPIGCNRTPNLSQSRHVVCSAWWDECAEHVVSPFSLSSTVSLLSTRRYHWRRRQIKAIDIVWGLMPLSNVSCTVLSVRILGASFELWSGTNWYTFS